MERDAAHAFDFLEGRWRARCRSPRPDGTWDEAEGTLTASKVLDGTASLELFEGPYCGTPIKAIGLRAFDPRTQEWSHTWTDTTTPGEFHVWRGRLAEGQVALHSSWLENGHTVLSRLTWSRIEGRSAHWESHRSTDGGRTWEPHWLIDFERVD